MVFVFYIFFQNRCLNMEKSNISFKFSKTSSKPIVVNSLDNIQKDTDYVISVDESEIKSTLASKPKQLIIPLIKKNKWRVPEYHKDDSPADSEEAKIERLAIQELIKESTEQNEEWDNRESTKQVSAIPLIMQNKIPDGYETEDKVDVSLRPDESSLEDYERVPVEEYGLAMLRGMGWKEGAAIGANNKQFVKPVEVKLRPKGLGLGADATVLQKTQKKSSEKEKLDLIKGAYIHIQQGSHKGFYGQVLSLDEENARVFVKLSSEDKTITIPEFYTRVVNKKEFDKESRIINRASYENYKRSEEKKVKSQKRNGDGETSSVEQRNKLMSVDVSCPPEKHSKKRKHAHDHRGSNTEETYIKPWIRPHLKARFIDNKYKKGKYFNKKVVVFDVFSPTMCSCKTEDGRYLEDISSSMLETVVPRDETAYVMIVQGKHKGELCIILKRDKSRCLATVQFLSDRSRVETLEYDSICEYVGNIEQYD